MIIIETVTIGDRQFRRTYNDADVIIRKVGTDEHYSEAYDLPDTTYEYEETDKKVEIPE